MSIEAGNTIGVLGFFSGLFKRIRDRPPLNTPGNIFAYETTSKMSQLELKQQHGTDIYFNEDIFPYFIRLNEEGFFIRKNKIGKSIVTESEDRNKISALTNTGIKLSVDGIKRGNLNLIVAGEEIPVPKSDAHYLKDMIPREILRIEADLTSRKISISYAGKSQPTPKELINQGRGSDKISVCQKL